MILFTVKMEESVTMEMDNNVLDKEEGCYDTTEAAFSDDEEEVNNKGELCLPEMEVCLRHTVTDSQSPFREEAAGVPLPANQRGDHRGAGRHHALPGPAGRGDEGEGPAAPESKVGLPPAPEDCYTQGRPTACAVGLLYTR